MLLIHKPENYHDETTPSDVHRAARDSDLCLHGICVLGLLHVSLLGPIRIHLHESVGTHIISTDNVRLLRLLEIFPEIFVGIYGFTAGESGLAFVMMFAGSIITVICSYVFDRFGQKWVRRNPNKQPEFLRLPLACVGGPLFVIALFWLGWTAHASIPWIVPLLSMIPYGVAYQMIFMAMINCMFPTLLFSPIMTKIPTPPPQTLWSLLFANIFFFFENN